MSGAGLLSRRERTLLLVALQTGLRVSEVIGLRCQDVVLETGAHVRCTGKGRKTHCIPLRKEVVAALRRWLRERNGQFEFFKLVSEIAFRVSPA